MHINQLFHTDFDKFWIVPSDDNKVQLVARDSLNTTPKKLSKLFARSVLLMVKDFENLPDEKKSKINFKKINDQDFPWLSGFTEGEMAKNKLKELSSHKKKLKGSIDEELGVVIKRSVPLSVLIRKLKGSMEETDNLEIFEKMNSRQAALVINTFISEKSYKLASKVYAYFISQNPVLRSSLSQFPQEALPELLDALCSHRNIDDVVEILKRGEENLHLFFNRFDPSNVVSYLKRKPHETPKEYLLRKNLEKKEKGFWSKHPPEEARKGNLELMRSYFGMIGEKLGKKELFDDFAPFFSANGGEKGFHVNAFIRFEEIQKDFLQVIKKHNYSTDLTLLKDALYSYNYPYIQNLLERIPLEEHGVFFPELLSALMQIEDPHLAELFLNQYPDIAKSCSKELLNQTITSNRFWFLNWLMKNGLKIDLSESEALLAVASKNHHLPMIKLLWTLANPSQPESNYLKTLHLDLIKSESKRIAKLMNYALFSPLQEIIDLVGEYPSYATALRRVLPLLGVVVRFPNLGFAEEANSNALNSPENYMKNTLAYARENRRFIMQTAKELKSLTRTQLLKKIIQNRFERNPHLPKEYGESQINNPNLTVTPFYASSFAMNEFSNTLSATLLPIRYTWCLRHLVEESYDFEEQTWHKPAVHSLELNNKRGLQYYYEFSDAKGDHRLTTTRIDRSWKWMHHTSPLTIKKLKKHLNSLQEELLLYPLDLGNEENVKVFFEKVARGYWLIATLCEFHRGTPHNAMIWLNCIYNHHNLPTPIPKLDHFFLDNTMIVLPLEKVIEKWSSFFEPTLDQALTTKYPKTHRKVLLGLLKADGLLLKECSPKVRADPKFIEAAVTQNHEASKYSIRL